MIVNRSSAVTGGPSSREPVDFFTFKKRVGTEIGKLKNDFHKRSLFRDLASDQHAILLQERDSSRFERHYFQGHSGKTVSPLTLGIKMRRTLITFAALVASASAFAPTGFYTGRSMQFACLALPSCVMSPLLLGCFRFSCCNCLNLSALEKSELL
jgi:hypothetical protein